MRIAARAEQRQFRVGGAAHLQDDVRCLVDVSGAGTIVAPAAAVISHRECWRQRRAGLDDDGVTAAGGELLHRFWRGSHTCFARVDFGRNADAHQLNPSGRTRIQLLDRSA